MVHVISVRLPDELYRELLNEAKNRNYMTTSELVRDWIREKLREMNK